MARLMKKTGYDTAMAGKWHCNSRFDSKDQTQPNDHGFDHWFATQNNASPSHKDPKNFVRNGQPVGPLNGFSCQIVMDEALNWLNKRQEKKSDQNTNPFFLYIAFHEPHEPVASPEKLVNSYLGITQSREQAEYFANVTNVDLAVGRLLDRLKKTRLDENTLVIFTSDNGPETLNRYRSANRSFGTPGLLKGMKLWTNEAGFRVAGIFYWPGKIKSGRTSVPLSALDLLPTFCSFADSELPKNLKLDGMDISSFLMGEELEQSRPLIWAYYNSINKQRVAMRFKNWKVLATIDGGRFPKVQNIHNGIIEKLRSAVLTDFEIYDVTADIGETKNLVTSLPEGPKLIGLIQQEYQNLLQDSYVWQRHQ
ncbi:MAG: sulfatase-like hydrolase/transferase, partial [Planctomycetota bacterium]